MLDTHSQSAQPSPRIEVRWEDVEIWGFDPAPSETPTATVAPEVLPPARASLPPEVFALATASSEAPELLSPLSLRQGTTFAPEDALAPARAKLDQIRKEEDVREAVVKFAELVLGELAKASLLPARVVLSADHEIAFVFFGDDVLTGGAHRRVATLTCSEDGVSAMLQDRRDDKVQAWDVEVERITDTVDRIRSFVAGK